MKRLLTLIPVLALTFGCVHEKAKEIPPSTADFKAKSEFEKGLKLMDRERYADAVKVFESILIQTPATEFDFIVQYNLASAQEGVKDCKSAAEGYRQVARGAARKFSRLEAMALLRLAYTYECLGMDNKALVALIDVRRRASALPEDTMKAEVPARMAAAYARAGNRKEAEKYFLEALDGIKFLQVKYKDSLALADKLSEALYFMGRSNVSDREFKKNPVSQIRGLQMTQIYLLQAAELGSAKWSPRAVEEILATYQKIWQLTQDVEDVEGTDPGMKKRLTADLRQEILRQTLKSVRSLRAQRIPSRTEAGESRRLFARLEEEDRRLTSVLSEVSSGSMLTPEAEGRQGLKADGRVKSKKTILEQSKGK